MNPIQNLTDKTFKELDYYELLQVMNAYCDENNYDNYFDCNPKSTAHRPNAILSFEKTIGHISILEQYFKYWTD